MGQTLRSRSVSPRARPRLPIGARATVARGANRLPAATPSPLRVGGPPLRVVAFLWQLEGAKQALFLSPVMSGRPGGSGKPPTRRAPQAPSRAPATSASTKCVLTSIRRNAWAFPRCAEGNQIALNKFGSIWQYLLLVDEAHSLSLCRDLLGSCSHEIAIRRHGLKLEGIVIDSGSDENVA